MRHEKQDLTHFFAWARLRAYEEFEARLTANPELDPNWTFSEIMQRLLEEYRELKAGVGRGPDETEIKEIGDDAQGDLKIS